MLFRILIISVMFCTPGPILAAPLNQWLQPEPEETLYTGDSIKLTLVAPSFVHVSKIAEMINQKLGGNSARAIDDKSLRVNAPRDRSKRISFVAWLLTLEYQGNL